MGSELALEEIYDAAFDDEAFAHLLERVAAALDARSYVAGWHFNDGGSTLFRHSKRWSSEQMALYNREFALLDLWNVAALRHWNPYRANDMSRLVSDREVENSVLYNEFLRPLGDDTYRVVSVPTENRFGKGALAFHRGKSQAGFASDSVRLLDSYAVHLGRLAALRGRFSALEREAASTASVLNALGQPIFLLSSSGRLVHANAAAERLLNGRAGLVLKQGVLSATWPAAARDIHAAVARAVAQTAPVAGAVAVPLANGEQLRLSVIAVPDAAKGTRNVLLTALEAPRSDQTIQARLRDFYGLSAGEASIAAMLAGGDSPLEIAEQRGVSIATVRTQIKAVAAKLGCHRLTDIVRIVASLPVLHAPDGVSA